MQKIRICRENLLKLNDKETTNYRGVDITIKDNKIILNGTVTNQGSQIIEGEVFAVIKQYAYLKIKEISGTISGPTYRLYLTSNDAEMSNSIISATGKETETIKNTSGVVKNLGIYLNSGAVFENYTIEAMLVESKVAIDFEEYNGEDITLDLDTTELAKIVDANGNVVAQDRAVYREVDGVKKWQWEKNVGKLVSAVSEGFNSNGAGTYTSNYLTPALNIEENKTYDTLNAICNVMKSSGGAYTTIFGTTSTGKIRLNIENSFFEKFGVTTLKGLFIKLNDEGNPFTLYYPHKTPEYEDCTAEQSAVLDKLYKLQLERGVNNVFIESENGVTCEMQLEYMQDSNLIREQEHKNFEDRITAIENLLSTTATSAILLDNLEKDLESEVK